LRRIGVAEVIRSAVEQVGVEEDVGTAVVLAVGGVAAVPGIGDVVDDVAVAGAVGSEGGEIGLVGIQVVFVAGIVDDIEVLDVVGLDAAAAIAVDDVVEDEGRGRVAAEIEDDAVAVGMVGSVVELADDGVVGDDVVEAGVGIEPLAGVERDAAGPAPPGDVGGVGGDVAVVADEVVIGGDVIAMDGGDAGAAGIANGVADEAEVVRAGAVEAVEGVALAVEVEVAEFEVGGVRGEAAAIEAEHDLAVGGAGVIDIDGAVAVSLIDDPRGWSATGGRRESGREAVGSAEEADDRAGAGGGSGAGEGFGRRRTGAGIAAAPRRRSIQRAIGGEQAVADGNGQRRAAGSSSFGVLNLHGKGKRTGENRRARDRAADVY